METAPDSNCVPAAVGGPESTPVRRPSNPATRVLYATLWAIRITLVALDTARGVAPEGSYREITIPDPSATMRFPTAARTSVPAPDSSEDRV